MADWEGYKPRLRDHALGILVPDVWTEAEIGSGAILERTIDAIEIADSRGLTNNLVGWPSRWGHASREHRFLLDARSNADLRRELERCLYGLYRGDADEGTTFGHLSKSVGAKYPLLAYLYFLKDMDRFMPIRPRTFDRAFHDFGIDLVTERNCTWENFQRFNTALGEVRKALAAMDGLTKVRLIDAHSFCWMLARQLKGDREKSIIEMRKSVENTVRNANGQIVERTVKNKELHMTQAELDDLLRSRLDLQLEALSRFGQPEIFNTDQGAQFTADAFTSVLLARGIKISMDGKGRCIDNVFIERLWRSLKYEDVYLNDYDNPVDARGGIDRYLGFLQRPA